MAGTKGMTHYTVETKLEAVRLHEEEGLSYAQVAEQLGLRKAERIESLGAAVSAKKGRPGLARKRSRATAQSTHGSRTDWPSLRDGECAAKKISYRVAQNYAREARYRVIEHYRGSYPVSGMCTFFGISRAAYYAWRKRMDQPDPDAERKQQILEAYDASKKTYGYRRIGDVVAPETGGHHQSQGRLAADEPPGHPFGGPPAQERIRKMSQLETYHHYENVLNRDFTATRPNQKWVTDITYIATQQGWAYLSTIKDLFGGFIVAHALSLSNSVALVTQTLQLAKRKRKGH